LHLHFTTLTAWQFRVTQLRIVAACWQILKKQFYFYSPLDKFGELSNFAGFGFEYEIFTTLLLSISINRENSSTKITRSKSDRLKHPKSCGHGEKKQRQTNHSRLGWNKERHHDIGVQRKFDSHEKFKNLLLSTGDNLIIENSPYDNYWGIGSTGDGLNQLGTTLMRVRQKLNNAL